MKRLLRYLVGRRRLVIRIAWDQPEDIIEVSVDADFAGCRLTRRSTCGGGIRWRGGLVKTWAKTLPTLALSTGESELGATVRGAAEALGMKSIMQDLGYSLTVALSSDATAAIGMTKRVGLGAVRHLSTADLWIQQMVRHHRLKLEKWAGPQNPSDLMTKHLDRTTICSHLERIDMRSIPGRAECAPVRPGTTPRLEPSQYDEDAAPVPRTADDFNEADSVDMLSLEESDCNFEIQSYEEVTVCTASFTTAHTVYTSSFCLSGWSRKDLTALGGV